ncbi:hypothetical protein DRN97_08415 [Methanosarcinales archaeon]|nr:MAG: hypothetical protein DRN97_08415 [Methanosarcinales archaeon]
MFVLITATASGTTAITIGNVSSAYNVTVPIMINNVEDVAVVTVNITYDPSVIHVTDAGNSDFQLFFKNLCFVDKGWVKMGAYQVMNGLSGDVKFAELNITPVGSPGETTNLEIEVITLTDSEDKPIKAAVKNGSFTIEGHVQLDTGAPEDPYPSIGGTHYGTIKPNKTIMVCKLYTYPCPGTGGHAEYVEIRNNSGWNVSARWDGYEGGDWHNICFDERFTLQAGVEYNYTIVTGSYPQIHHKKELTMDNGIITCTQFIDINGKKHKDWIPAIKLGSCEER